MTQESANRPQRPVGPPTRWQENHGNLLLGFVLIVLVCGVSILFYRQSRFVPPRFPESDMITTPATESDLEDTSDQTANMVTIKVIGAISDDGAMKIAIYGSESDFDQTVNPVASSSSLIVEGESVWAVSPEELPPKFVVAAYHDQDGDGVLNRNRLGIPTERYGFSQNARGVIGPPSYEQSVIDRPAAGESINIFIR